MLRKGLLVLAWAAATACANEQPALTESDISAPLYARGGNGDINMGTHLTGHEEVFAGSPGPADSDAQGQAIFRVEGDSVSFRLIASNIANINQAHIHCGRFGENGPVRMWLHPVIGPSGAAVISLGRFSGVLAAGKFSPAGVTCPAANVGTLMPLLDAMRAGLTYVNVHTTNNVSPTNEGPGDFPGGEIRGQID